MEVEFEIGVLLDGAEDLVLLLAIFVDDYRAWNIP